MKNVLIVTSVASMIEQFNIPIIKLLKKMGFKVTVATNFKIPGTIPIEVSKKLYNDLKTKDVNVADIPFSRFPISRDNLFAFREIKQIIDNNNFDIIYCQSPVGGAITRLAAINSRRKKANRVIYTAHGFHFYKGAPKRNWLFFYPLEKLLAKVTDDLITINFEDYARAKKFDAKKVHYVPGVGIDIPKIDSVNVDINKKRRELGLKEGQIGMLSIGELSPRKNHEAVIRSLSNYSSENFIYYICGLGELKEELLNLATSLGIGDKVVFLGYRNDILEICKSLDLFIFPSKQEGLPVALMEAMASGMPVVVSDIRGNRDLVDDSKGGFIFKVEEISQLEEIFGNVFAGNIKMEKMSEYNKNKITDFSMTAVMNEMKKIYTN